MFSFNSCDVNGIFERLVQAFIDRDNCVEEESRVGSVVYMDGPVCITYRNPLSRVLFNRERDANPFFHLYESLWMLAGKNDLESLQYYVSTFDNYSDDKKTLNGAYGYRWRHNGARYREYLEAPQTDRLGKDGIDQIEILIEHLKTTPNSRRAVLQMWNVEDDLLKSQFSKDVCCNLSVCFSIRKGLRSGKMVPILDMTVFNRSNDAIWGTTGANAVHFSFLQEYVASHLGIGVGYYHQITNNLHVYTERFDPAYSNWLEDFGYLPRINVRIPLISNPARFDLELSQFIKTPPSCECHPEMYQEPFFKNVAVPVRNAFIFHKERQYICCLDEIKLIADDAWRIACENWVFKRKKLWEAKQQTAM
jgi:thymidylate synthase